METKRMTRFGLLIALAFIFSYIETLFPFVFPVPGMKIGLANIVVVTALYELGGRDAFLLSLVRILLVSLTFGGGFSPMMYSLGGGILSAGVMILLQKTGKFSAIGVSVAGGVCHNIGQICVAALILGTAELIYYLPWLMIGGAVTGVLIGIAGAEAVKRVHKYLRN
jgi:heptaprenyl diphosphate synthase